MDLGILVIKELNKEPNKRAASLSLLFISSSSLALAVNATAAPMGKKGGTSWLTAVKRAFRSPSKENDKKSSKQREEQELEDEEKVSKNSCLN